MKLKNKKVLLLGLGLLGGGVSTAKWLVAQGAILTVTDLKTKQQLAPSLHALGKIRKKIKFILGEHRPQDILDNDIIVVNPGVAFNNKYLLLAQKNKKIIINELGLFCSLKLPADILAVTGTRGKTTTTAWLHHFIRQSNNRAILAGNNPAAPLFTKVAKIKKAPVVIEIPSFLLENLGGQKIRPKAAIVTNIYRDHLNRYKDFGHYAKTKARIFFDQTARDILILNRDNKWTSFLLKQKPKAKVLFFSIKKLLTRGAFIKKDRIIIKIKKEIDVGSASAFAARWGQHNLENLLATALSAIAYGVAPAQIKKAMKNLPQLEMRQQLIFSDGKIAIYNDSAGTSPEATMAAAARFKNNNLILIAGGTDGNLAYKEWSKFMKKNLKLENLILLSGSATKKILKELKENKVKVYETLAECFNEALKKTGGSGIIVFSPGAKSFEKFKNEFDRGRQFNKLVYGKFKKSS